MENLIEQNTNKFWGIVVYEIVGNGCLNGLWTNNDAKKGGSIMNEIARKSDKKESEIIGDYTVAWIEADQEAVTGTLKITPNGITYNFEWFVENEDRSRFKAIGMQVGLSQVVAFYWKSGDTFCV